MRRLDSDNFARHHRTIAGSTTGQIKEVIVKPKLKTESKKEKVVFDSDGIIKNLIGGVQRDLKEIDAKLDRMDRRERDVIVPALRAILQASQGIDPAILQELQAADEKLNASSDSLQASVDAAKQPPLEMSYPVYPD
jgi:hypothetical protein